MAVSPASPPVSNAFRQRIVVMQADARQRAGIRSPLSVGAARWRGEGDHVAMVAKLTLAFDRGGASTTASVVEPERVSGDVESELSEGAVAYPTDFILAKAQTDVMLQGHAHHAPPATTWPCRIAVGELEHRFIVTASDATPQIPLLARFVRDLDGHPTDRVGPGRVEREEETSVFSDTDPVRFQAAAEKMRGAGVEPGATLELSGLSPRAAERRVVLPGVAPRLFYEASLGVMQEMDLSLDTLHVDTDFERITLVWRALLPSRLLPRIDRVVASLEVSEAPREEKAILDDLPRGTQSFAIEEEDFPGDEDELLLASYEVLEYCAQPELSIDDYAKVVAALAEKRKPRKDELDEHGFDERSWTIEERAWTEKKARAADRGDGSLAVAFGEAFVAAQDDLAQPHEPRDLETYARVSARVERSPRPDEELDKHGIGPGEYARLERHWLAEAEGDPEVASELEALVKQEREAMEDEARKG